MHIHFLGICGTFMGSLALLVRAQGHQISGSDSNVYPPMSTQLRDAGIDVYEGFDQQQFSCEPDLVVIGNAMSRGNEAVEYVLDNGLPYCSGPELLAREVLQDKWVIALAGTHGKTTTTAMCAWILEFAGMSPGYLIGGVPQNFLQSARLGETPFFVIEADEYDSAFFDKRSKFIHYRPRTLVLNNLEFDHADIFDDLEAIKRQFNHLVRTVPQSGQIIVPQTDANIQDVLDRECFTPVVGFAVDQLQSAGVEARLLAADGSAFEVCVDGRVEATVRWQQTGLHNVSNGVAAMLAAHHVGVTLKGAAAALCGFAGVKRRLECLGEYGGITIYDDFAHHPTAIETTLQGLRQRVGDVPIWAVIEPRSNTMRMGVHQQRLAQSAALADQVHWYQPADLDGQLDYLDDGHQSFVHGDLDRLLNRLSEAKGPVHIVLMSNGGFGGVHQKLLQRLEQQYG